MNTIKYLVVAAGLSLALLPASAAAAKVCDYGVFSVENPSDGATLYYSVRLGDDSDWVGEYTLPPRTVRTHYFALDADGRAPTPSIRFHDSVAVRQYGLEFFQVDPRTDYGMTYHFATTRSGRWDLFTGDAPGEWGAGPARFAWFADSSAGCSPCSASSAAWSAHWASSSRFPVTLTGREACWASACSSAASCPGAWGIGCAVRRLS